MLRKSFIEKITKKYEQYRAKAAKKVDEIMAAHADQLAGYMATLAERSMGASGVRAIDFLRDRGIANETSGEDIEQLYQIDLAKS